MRSSQGSSSSSSSSLRRFHSSSSVLISSSHESSSSGPSSCSSLSSITSSTCNCQSPDHDEESAMHAKITKLPLPPAIGDTSLRRPPPASSAGGKGLRMEEDPFMAAYMECTKSYRESSATKKKEKKKKSVSFWGINSCKKSGQGAIREDGLVKASSKGENIIRARDKMGRSKSEGTGSRVLAANFN